MAGRCTISAILFRLVRFNKELTTPVDGYSSATVTRDNIKKAGGRDPSAAY
jgi:hypothetical protein